MKSSLTRNEFMSFFRDDDKLNTLTNDDRIEIFCQILSGGSSLTKNLLDSLLSDYSQDSLEVIDLNDV